MVVWFECEMTHTGSCVGTLSPQLVVPFQVAVETLEEESLWWEEVSHRGRALRLIA